MANTDAPQGFIPLRHLTGGVIRPQEYPIANSYAANLASGDLVSMTTDGTVIRGTAGGTALGVFYGAQASLFGYMKDNDLPQSWAVILTKQFWEG